MNWIEVSLTAFLAALLSLVGIFLLQRASLESSASMPEQTIEAIVAWLSTEENQTVINAYLDTFAENIRHRVTSSIGGTLSGFSRGLDSMENDLIEASVEQSGNPMMTAIFQKYGGKNTLLNSFLKNTMAQNPMNRPPGGQGQGETPEMQ